MLDSFIDGICAALRAGFPDVPTIYTEQVKQGFNMPCFTISCDNPSEKHILDIRYRRDFSFTITFIPPDNSNAALYRTAEKLFQTLDYIEAEGSLYRGSGLRCEFKDGSLLFFASYTAFIYYPRSYEVMEELSVISSDI